MQKDLRKLVKKAKKLGWTVEVTGGTHLKWIPPWDADFVMTGSTPSDYRAWKNICQRLRRAGLKL